MSYLLEDIDSTLIKDIEYNPDTLELRITFRKYYVNELVYEKVPFTYFEEFSCPTGKSHGRFYLEMIKPKFKLKNKYMADKKDLGVNQCSDKKRFIKMRLNVLEFNKEWFFQGEEGVYTDITLALLPNGTLDRYGHLGMVTQDVPKAVYQADKTIQGNILGNGFEFKQKSPEGSVTSNIEKKPINDGVADDLPF